MIHGIEKVNLEKLFCIDEDGRTRKYSSSLKIRRHVNTKIGFNFFIKRVINYWNYLTHVVVSCKFIHLK